MYMHTSFEQPNSTLEFIHVQYIDATTIYTLYLYNFVPLLSTLVYTRWALSRHLDNKSTATVATTRHDSKVKNEH